MTDLYVVDTHVLIWYFIGSKRLNLVLKEKIDEIRDRNGRLLVPTIVLAEALDIAEKGKVTFDFSTMHQLVRKESESDHCRHSSILCGGDSHERPRYLGLRGDSTAIIPHRSPRPISA